MYIIELSDSGKITITIDSCKLFTIHDTIMIVINNINFVINACNECNECNIQYLHVTFVIPAIDHSWND